MTDLSLLQTALENMVSAPSLNALGHTIVRINEANGWNVMRPHEWESGNPYRIPGVLALIHSEVSEALEAVRKMDRANFEEELADVVIRVLDLAIGLDIDLDKAVIDKLIKNCGRGFRHGGKKV